jgi:hypothetical protein
VADALLHTKGASVDGAIGALVWVQIRKIFFQRSICENCLQKVCSNMFFQQEMQEKRESTGANGQTPPPSPWVLFIGEVEMVVYILFHWWGYIL